MGQRTRETIGPPARQFSLLNERSAGTLGCAKWCHAVARADPARRDAPFSAEQNPQFCAERRQGGQGTFKVVAGQFSCRLFYCH